MASATIPEMAAKYGGERILAGSLREGDVLIFARCTVITFQKSEDGSMIRAVCMRGGEEIVYLWTKNTPIIIRTREAARAG